MSPVNRRIWFYGTWAKIIAAAIGALAIIGLVGFLGCLVLVRWGGREWFAGCLLLAGSLALFVLFCARVRAFCRNLRAGIQSELQRNSPTRGENGLPEEARVSPLACRIEIYCSWAQVIAATLGALYIIGAVGIEGYRVLASGQLLAGCGIMATGLALLLLFGSRMWAFRRNLHTGIRRELKRRNYCPHCEYDLRASATRCPECGHFISESVEI